MRVPDNPGSRGATLLVLPMRQPSSTALPWALCSDRCSGTALHVDLG